MNVMDNDLILNVNGITTTTTTTNTNTTTTNTTTTNTITIEGIDVTNNIEIIRDLYENYEYWSTIILQKP